MSENNLMIINLPTTGEIMHQAIKEANMEEQMLRQLFLSAPRSKIFELMEERSLLELTNSEDEFNRVKQSIMDEWGLSEEDMNDDSQEDKVNREVDSRLGL